MATTEYVPPAIVVLVNTALPDAVVAVPKVEPEVASVKVTVSPFGGAGAIVAVRVVLVPTVTVAWGEMASVVVVCVLT